MANPTYYSEIAQETLALFYKFSEASGTLTDSSGNSVDLDVIAGAPTYARPSLIPSIGSTCITLTESGTSELTSTNNNPASLTGDVAWTACWWGGGHVQGGDRDFIRFSDYIIRIRSSGNYIGLVHGVTNVASFPYDGIGASTGYMYGLNTFFAIVHDQPNNLYKLYLNGKFHTNSSTYSTTPLSNDRAVKIGGSTGIDQSIQGLAVIPSALSAARILELYFAGVAGQTSAPIP